MSEPLSELLYEDKLAGACHWSLRMPRGTSLRLIDLEGGANVGMLFYNPLNLLERYNAPDTLKCQHTFKLSKGHCLYSDMGRIFCSIVEDSVGWHDTVCGNTNKNMVKEKWGEHSYQDYHNDWYQNGNDSFLVELAKHGLGLKDMAANVNWFSKVSVSEQGQLNLAQNNSKPNDFIELRFEMETLVIFHTCPHPLSQEKEYPRKPLVYQIRKSSEPSTPDICFDSCEENRRGHTNTAIYQMGMETEK